MERFEPGAFKGRKAGVLGLGRSGTACAKLLLSKGFSVFASDSRPAPELKAMLGRAPKRLDWEGGRHSRKLLQCAFVVKSPGLSPDLPILSRLRDARVPVYSELEVALAFCKARDIVAVTGTNGKTTTTTLTGEVFRQALPRGRRAAVCGNIGIPFSEAAPKLGAKDCLVAEVSSYQLEDSRHFRPRAAAILNITPDHLDHHGGMDRYLSAKARIFQEQSASDLCVFNAEDPLCLKMSRDCPAKKLYFGLTPQPFIHAWMSRGKIRIRLPGSRRELSLSPPALPGRHNLENAMASALLALGLDLELPKIQKAFTAFRGVEHRLEDLGLLGGLRCLNDSKATNVDSTMVALKSLESVGNRVFLILGGLHKGSSYKPLAPFIAKSAKAILTIGSAAAKIEEDLRGTKPLLPCSDLETAVETAFQVASPGDVLLLSPACASFDQFKNFEERGSRFKALVRARAKTHGVQKKK
ncbi:MAG: UDP-N-acetylmuramoyl-L-alanine--D-glutamate ligase [Elusimicrobia bacterium]|nr:UDP-N-acetylmuramoyl-L-alanine--D-glutamate ligase [Elusimicrobiota bacterium]